MSENETSIGQLIQNQEELDSEILESKFNGITDYPVLIIFGLLFATVFLQFFTRYVLNDSLAWTEEAARYLLIIVAFVGTIKCELLDSHIRLEFIDQLLRKHVGFLKQTAALLSIIYFGFLGVTLYKLAVQTSFQNMVSLPFPKYYFYAIILVALAVLVAVQIFLFVRRFRGTGK